MADPAWNGVLRSWVADESGAFVEVEGGDLATVEGTRALAAALTASETDAGFPPIRREAIVALQVAARKPVAFSDPAMDGLARSAPQTAIDWEHDTFFQDGFTPQPLSSQGVTLSSTRVLVSRDSGDVVGLLDVQEIRGQHALAEMAGGVALGSSVVWDFADGSDELTCSVDGTPFRHGPCGGEDRHWFGDVCDGEQVLAVVPAAVRISTALTKGPAGDTRLGMLTSNTPFGAALRALSARPNMADPKSSPSTKQPNEPLKTQTAPADKAELRSLRTALDGLKSLVSEQADEIQSLRADRERRDKADNDRLSEQYMRGKSIRGERDKIAALRAESPDHFDRIMALVADRPVDGSTPPAGPAPKAGGGGVDANEVIEMADKLVAQSNGKLGWSDAYNQVMASVGVGNVNPVVRN